MTTHLPAQVVTRKLCGLPRADRLQLSKLQTNTGNLSSSGTGEGGVLPSKLWRWAKRIEISGAWAGDRLDYCAVQLLWGTGEDKTRIITNYDCNYKAVRAQTTDCAATEQRPERERQAGILVV